MDRQGFKLPKKGYSPMRGSDSGDSPELFCRAVNSWDLAHHDSQTPRGECLEELKALHVNSRICVEVVIVMDIHKILLHGGIRCAGHSRDSRMVTSQLREIPGILCMAELKIIQSLRIWWLTFRSLCIVELQTLDFVHSGARNVGNSQDVTNGACTQQMPRLYV